MQKNYQKRKMYEKNKIFLREAGVEVGWMTHDRNTTACEAGADTGGVDETRT
ncbi:MAG: hypothetical protein LUE64_02215 [Candidatus Gastranaerophilales bacterium]|nr:hypothetical protein [Candidatus Gastranaerophilales bacterium]